MMFGIREDRMGKNTMKIYNEFVLQIIIKLLKNTNNQNECNNIYKIKLINAKGNKVHEINTCKE